MVLNRESLECGREDVEEALREEKKRKKMEALAEDLFNHQEVSFILIFKIK